MDDSFVGQFIPDRDNLAFSTAGILVNYKDKQVGLIS